MPQPYDFANILFAGPCNLRCPYCIGQQIDPALSRNNLNEFPLRNLDQFVKLLKHHQVSQIVFTGTTTDPQLYRHELRLLNWLREQLVGSEERPIQYSLHTNGQLALRKMDIFNQYDRVCISFPSFEPEAYHKMMGSPRVPDLAKIVWQSEIPVKVSTVVNEHNVDEIGYILERCAAIGVKRLVLRQLYKDDRTWPILQELEPTSIYRNNPVYDINGMEVTYWRFQETTSTSLNLFSDGTISAEYLLTNADRGALEDKLHYNT